MVMTAALCGACAAPEAQIPADVLQRMQEESRGEIYDRENDLSIARNKLDDVEARAAAVRRQLVALDETVKRVRVRFGKAGSDKAIKLDRPISARRNYLTAQLRQLAAQRGVAEAQAAAARGRLEQTRQRELARTGRALAKSMVPFDRNVEALDKRVQERERHEDDLKQDTERAYESWKAAENEYAKSTGDWDTAVWTD